MIDEFGPKTEGRTQCPIQDTADEIRMKVGLPPGGVSFEGLTQIEETYSWESTRKQKNSIKRKIGFAVFDIRLNLRRLPPHQEYDSNNKYVCNMVMYGGHAYGFRDPALARICRDTALSWYKACITIAQGESPAPKGKQKHSDLFKQAWDLFRECQYMQPDMDLIRSYIDKKYDFEVTSLIGIYRPTPTQKVWAPKNNFEGLWSCRPAKKGDTRGNAALEVEAKGLKVRSNILRIQPGNQTQENIVKMRALGLKFKTFDEGLVWIM